MTSTHCVKITEKVSFNIVSEAATFTFEWMKNAKNGPIWQVLKPTACSLTELPDGSVIIGQKLVENAKNGKIQLRHFG